MPKLAVSIGDDTEDLLQGIIGGLTEEELESVDIDRALETSEGMSGEPVTIGAVITGSAVVISAVLRLIERHLETKRQEAQMRLVAEGFREDPALGKQLGELAKKHADVS